MAKIEDFFDLFSWCQLIECFVPILLKLVLCESYYFSGTQATCEKI